MAYLTVAEADTYFSTRLNANAWDTATENDKSKALETSTRAIDRLNFIGSRADSTQDNQFPRGTDTVVPEDIKQACAENALALLDGVDPEMEYQDLNITSHKYESVSAGRGNKAVNHIASGIVSSIAWRLLKPYLRDPKQLHFLRIS